MPSKYQEFKAMESAQLNDELGANEFQYQQTRFEASVKGVRSPNELKEMRRDIARIKTEQRRRELEAMSAAELAQRSKIRARRRK
ncbi:MAG: 50S ribosomal protein L29 [Saprospiraceae bacterium]|nr:50S ribosomal protein L29 [Saprospiraceae bacterium]MBP7699706.1 50S ribosomal protein L29 [Saprospiraceae bacterium]